MKSGGSPVHALVVGLHRSICKNKSAAKMPGRRVVSQRTATGVEGEGEEECPGSRESVSGREHAEEGQWGERAEGSTHHALVARSRRAANAKLQAARAGCSMRLAVRHGGAGRGGAGQEGSAVPDGSLFLEPVQLAQIGIEGGAVAMHAGNHVVGLRSALDGNKKKRPPVYS